MTASLDTILHVEDRDEDVTVLQYAFKRAEILNPVQHVSDGQQAIDYLSAHGRFADRVQFPLPGLVLMDLKLPQKMGLEVIDWMRQHSYLKAVVVIVFSSSINEGDIQHAYELGANAFLVKPSDVETTIDMCKAIKHFWLTYNRSPRSPYWAAAT